MVKLNIGISIHCIFKLSFIFVVMFSDNDHYEEMHYTSCTNNMNLQPVQVKLLCGADLLESFAVPGLWKDEDVRVSTEC